LELELDKQTHTQAYTYKQTTRNALPNRTSTEGLLVSVFSVLMITHWLSNTRILGDQCIQTLW